MKIRSTLTILGTLLSISAPAQGLFVDLSSSIDRETLQDSIDFGDHEFALPLLEFPVTLADCAAGANDCCHPVCRPMISGCCVSNHCGLQVQRVIRGRGIFLGREVSCSLVLPDLSPGID